MTDEQKLKIAILQDIVKTFRDLKTSTARRALVIKFRNQPASYAINELVYQSIIRRKNTSVATTDEEYLPAAAAFELCGDNRLREEAKHASIVVLHTLQNMFIGEQKKEGFNFQDLKRHVEYIYTNQTFDDGTLKLGLYLASVVRQTDRRVFRVRRARFTFSRMSVARAVQMNGLGLSLWRSM